MSKKEFIVSLIQKQLETYHSKTTVYEEGVVLTVADGIAVCDGLQDIMYGELVEFANGVFGMANNLEEHSVGIVIFNRSNLIKSGDKVIRTKRLMEVGVGDYFLGRVVNVLGSPIDGLGEIPNTKRRPIERIAPGVMTRQSVNAPLETGILGIDSIVPIGKGQRELIIGDRQTGKSALVIDAIINQKDKGVLCVYVAIGQKNSTIAQVRSKLIEHGAMKHTVIVFAGASESPSLQFLAPYMGITLAEEWMEKGKDVLIAFDDLSKHAVAYRTMSLLLRRPPGREAYPGDVFYLHSRLLERAARIKDSLGGGSITALPIVETKAGDISGYIPTNVISITDGQIFLMADLFNAGIMPAVDFGLSVSRVGGAAQIEAIKMAAKTLKLDLAQYSSLKAFSQFSSDVDDETKMILNHGERITRMLKQNQYHTLNQNIQVLYLILMNSRLIAWVPLEQIENLKTSIENNFEKEMKVNDLMEKLLSGQDVKKVLKDLEIKLASFVKYFLLRIPNYDYKKYGKKEDFDKL